MSITVFGSFAADVTSRSAGLPRPGETLLGSSYIIGPGGKGSNQAVAAWRSGGDVRFVTRLGTDMFGSMAMDFYRAEGMDVSHIILAPEEKTGMAVIMVDEISAQNQIVVTSAACGGFTREDVEASRAVIEQGEVLLCQLEINFDALYAAIRMGFAAGARVILNPAPAAKLDEEIMALIDTVTPNETEAETLTGVKVETREDAEKAAQVFFRMGVRNVIITLGAQGVFVSDGKKSELIQALRVRAIDTTGAGDAFNGAFATALSEGKDLFDAARFGNVAAALSVTRIGTAPAMSHRDEIDRLYKETYGNG